MGRRHSQGSDDPGQGTSINTLTPPPNGSLRLDLGAARVLRSTDVTATRELSRQRRLARVAIALGLLAATLWAKFLITGSGWGWPNLGFLSGLGSFAPAAGLMAVLALVILVPMVGAGRSPHVEYRSSEIDITLDDVKGSGVVVEEVVRTLNIFLAHKTFRDRMGGTPRRAVLFEGPPGTGKTYMAKAMAAEAKVPFLFVSSSAFQSMYYGQTNRKIRSYFKALRKAARREGGAIGFIEEIDAIGSARSGMGGSGREGISGVVNELLIQFQSFDTPTRNQRLAGWFINKINAWLSPEHQLAKPKPVPANILVVGATNRASDLDPALLRPGRFDRSIYFDLPGKSGRRELIDYYLDRKAHQPELDSHDRRDALAAMTFGYSPVMIEHLFDEALVWALRRGAESLDWTDLSQAKMTEELGLAQPVEYAEAERRTIATHEAGHATVAYLVGKTRKLEVLSIIKRKDALGLLAHSETEERFTRTRTEIRALIEIAMGGMVAEELAFGEAGTGPAGDLSAATTAAAQMVGALGMAGSLISLEAAGGPPGANIVAKVLSTEAGREEVEKILSAAKTSAKVLLTDHWEVVEALRDALLERDELLGEEINEVVRAGLARGNNYQPSR
ncbi:MAG: AAA family ATPase [Acidimicrobiales bacterium]